MDKKGQENPTKLELYSVLVCVCVCYVNTVHKQNQHQPVGSVGHVTVVIFMQ